MILNFVDIKRLRQQVQLLFKITTELENAFPGRKFTLDGHLVGSIGEVIAAHHYNLKLLPSSSKRHDAITSDGRNIQIRTTQGNRSISLRSEPDNLIVIWINSTSDEVKEIFNDPDAPVWEAYGRWSSNGTRSIAVSRLKEMAISVPNE